MPTRIRAAVVVCDERRRVLLVRQDRDLWVIPGGGLEENETIQEAAIREVREETGLEVRLKRLLWFDEHKPRQTLHVDMIFMGEVVGGTLGRGEQECRYFTLEELEGTLIYPRWFAATWRKWTESPAHGPDPARLEA